MKKDFVDVHDAAVRLAAIVEVAPDCVVSIQPNGAVIARELAAKFERPIIEAFINKELIHTADAVEISIEGVAADQHILVIDDAVETGQAAMAVALTLKTLGFENIHLAVPVCPRQSEYQLNQIYRTITAVVRPLAKRSLTWHYEQIPATSAEDAHAIVTAHNQGFGFLQ
ncbi:MAG: Phosphoribosyl transferase domain [Actinomycetota bacterium]|jgi:predicted phosphoribosyltransferase